MTATTTTTLIPTTHDALLRAVLLAPHDDAPRLILADWYDENGQEDYAWYIREAIRNERGEVNDPFWQVNHEVSRVHRPDLGESGTCLVWRGFVREIYCTHDYFLENAAAIFAAHPAEKIVLTDKWPWNFAGMSSRWYWYNLKFNWASPYSDQIDDEIFQRLPKEYASSVEGHSGFPTGSFASDALSDACVALGRERAGLPPLPA